VKKKVAERNKKGLDLLFPKSPRAKLTFKILPADFELIDLLDKSAAL
jgi:hypothetical protein